MKDNVEFGELSDNFLRLLGLLYKSLPLSLQIFHNNFNLCNFMPTNKLFKAVHFRIKWSGQLGENHVKDKARPLKLALFPF